MKLFKKNITDSSLPEKPKNPLRLFGFLTVIIGACVAGFVIIIYVSMIKGAVNESGYVRIIEGVPTQIQAIAFEMEQWAVHISNEPNIKLLVKKGFQAIKSEGGGEGGPASEMVRQQLRDQILSNWGILSKTINPKEIQFFVGPELTSLLWINRPDVFGFSRSTKHSILFESYCRLMPGHGFET